MVSYPDPNVRNDDHRLQYDITMSYERTFGSGYETILHACIEIDHLVCPVCLFKGDHPRWADDLD